MKKSHRTPNGIDGTHSRVYRFYPRSSPKHRKVYKGPNSNGGENPIVTVYSDHLSPAKYQQYLTWRNGRHHKWEPHATMISLGCVNIRL